MPASLRYLVAGYLLDTEGKSVRVTDVVLAPQPPDVAAVPVLLMDKAQRENLPLHAGSPLDRDQVIPLPAIPRPATTDGRPLQAWAISAYIVAHDQKFAGYGAGIFHWPEQPADLVLAAMLDVMVADTLVPVFLEPWTGLRVELHQVTVAPSSAPATTYR